MEPFDVKKFSSLEDHANFILTQSDSELQDIKAQMHDFAQTCQLSEYSTMMYNVVYENVLLN